jgi:hypothetical protein
MSGRHEVEDLLHMLAKHSFQSLPYIILACREHIISVGLIRVSISSAQYIPLLSLRFIFYVVCFADTVCMWLAYVQVKEDLEHAKLAILDSDVAAFLPNKGNGLLHFVPFATFLFRL